MKYLQLLLLIFLYSSITCQITNTYIFGDIETNFQSFDESCSGLLQLQLPEGDSVEVLGVNIAYSMTATGSNWISDQRSRIQCLNSGLVESDVSGIGNSSGTYDYERSNVNIANGMYAGGTVLQFRMEAARTFDDGFSAACSATVNKVDNWSWTIEVLVDQKVPLVGINSLSPTQSLSVGGKLEIGDDFKNPTPGTMRYNESDQKFEGWTGTGWKSMSYSPTVYSYEQNPITDAFSSTVRDALVPYPDSLLIEEAGRYMCLFDLVFYNLAGNTTTLSSDRSAFVYFSAFNTNNLTSHGPDVVGLPNGFTFFFRTRETFRLHKIVDFTNPNSYMHIGVQVNSNPCCPAQSSSYELLNVKMTAIKLD